MEMLRGQGDTEGSIPTLSHSRHEKHTLQGMRRPLSQGTTGGTQVERHWARGEKKYLTKVKLRKVK